MNDSLGSPSGHGATERGLLHAAAQTATPPSQKVDAPPPRFEGRFGRMFPGLRGAAFFQEDMDSLADAMSAEDEGEATPETEVDSEENRGLPAGYTYFGQFIDHDITLDAVSLSMKQEALNETENFRTPALDLDSLYGRGPADQPYMYAENGGFQMSDRTLKAGAGGPVMTRDLPRLKGRAVIGDKRNDENVIVSQLHGLFMRLHNKFIGEGLSFDEARRQVQWHYQWLALYDYLPRIVGPQIVHDVLPHTQLGGTLATDKPQLKLYSWDKFPFMPVEFAGAAYRYGHSMVRPVYRLSRADDVGDAGRLPVFRPPVGGEALNGFREFPDTWGIDWSLFFETDGRKLGTSFTGKDRIQPAYKIDTSLVFPLKTLPEFSDADGKPKPSGAVNALAARNIRRGLMLQLPSGQAVARYMIEKGVPGVQVLDDDELLIGKADAEGFDDAEPISVPAVFEGGAMVRPPLRRSMQDSAPLWFYVLAEARHTWRAAATKALADAGGPSGAARAEVINAVPVRLGPAGGRIVAETLIGLVIGDENSFLNAASEFVPRFGNPTHADYFARFTFGDLLAFVA